VSDAALRDLFEACLELPPERWDEQLASCPDEELREQARRLLAAHQRAEAGDDPLVQVVPAAMPERVGPYRILERIGDGGMGEVYLAEQLEPVRRQVALKIIKLGMDTREVIARFEVERQTLALMSHPNVARILDAGATDSGRPYFVMEYVPGVPIVRYCDEQGLDIRARLELFIEVCAGVQHAHHRGVIHRDLKPSNILVTEIDGRPLPKIIDFGIAKATSLLGAGASPHTRLGHVLGTPGYMSPEQAELSPLDIDTRTDVYSLGALLYELLTGTVPLAPTTVGAGPTAIARVLYEHEVERPSARVRNGGDEAVERARRRGRTPQRLAAELSEDLDWIAMKALERDRRRRYDAVSGLAADIQASLSNRPVSAGPPSRLYRLRKFARRNRVLVASAAALFVASLVFGSLMALQARETARERDRATLEAATAQQVSQVLVDVFSASDPFTARGQALTARELLDKAARALGRERDLQPRVLARLQLAIGEVYLNLDLHEEAQALFVAARETLAGQVPEEDLDSLAARRGVGRTLLSRSRYDEADPILAGALEIASRAYGPEHAIRGDLTNDLGALRYYQGRNEEAAALLEQSYAARAAAFGENSRNALATLTNLAVARSRLGDHAGAEAILRDVVGRVERHLGEDHPELYRAGMNLAAEASRAGRHEESLEIYENLLPKARRVFGDTHGLTLTMSGNYAASLGSVDRHAEALALHQQVFEDVASTLGADSREAMFWGAHLGVSLAYNGRAAEAERLLADVLARQTRIRGADNFDTLNTRNAYGDMLAGQGRHEEAIAMVAPVPELALSSLGATSTIRRSAFLRLADASFALGRDDDGQRWWQAAAAFSLPPLTEYPSLERLLAEGRLQRPAAQ
jgi:eukaryotic-like serine/threonine-protein kinase